MPIFVLSNKESQMKFLLIFLAILLLSHSESFSQQATRNPDFEYREVKKATHTRVVDRQQYMDRLYGFWLGECIANWTGLITEMDKIGNIGDIKTGAFYTRQNWGQPDQPSIWGQGVPSALSPTIGYVFAAPDSTWGSDDDTDIEYIYQWLLLQNKTSVLSGTQIRDGWLSHIRHEEENFLWVANQRAFDLMLQGMVPPATGDPANNPEWEMIDAQLTTEIFGLFAPTRPDMALKMAELPIATVARNNSAWISNFYVSMYALASLADTMLQPADQLMWMAENAKSCLPDTSYAHKMYDFVKRMYLSGYSWEQARDSVYDRYQVKQLDGYRLTSRKLYCNGCFAGGINFASSLVSLFYGKGDIKETIKIGALCGWDSDNPTATWGGLLGFMIGKKGIEKAFNRTFSEKYNIHRTRTGFPNNGIDTFWNMALHGVWVTDRVVQDELHGSIDLQENKWYIPVE